MKKILAMLVLSLLVFGKVFAFDWVEYGTYENEEAGIYIVYFDYDATEPFDVKNESIEYYLSLKKEYENVEVKSYDKSENMWCSKGAEHNCYATLEVYKDYIMEDHVNSDGSVTEYIFW